MEFDAQQRMQTGIEPRADRCPEHGDINNGLIPLAQYGRDQNGDQRSDKSADTLETFNRQIRDTALFGVDRTHSHDQQRQRKGETVSKYFFHYLSSLARSSLSL